MPIGTVGRVDDQHLFRLVGELPYLRVESGYALWESDGGTLRGRFVLKAELSVGGGDCALFRIEELLVSAESARRNVNRRGALAQVR